jgi:hypothetical protein
MDEATNAAFKKQKLSVGYFFLSWDCLIAITKKQIKHTSNKITMKNSIVIIAVLALIPLAAMDALAQETEENVRMEYVLCQLNEGYTFDDVMAQSREYGEKVAADGNQYNQYLMRPMITGERLEGVTHIIAGMWPNGKALYDEYGDYVNKYIDENREDRAHTCRVGFATMDRIVIDDFMENETTDERWPLQLADCSLKDGVSMEYAVEVEREAHQAAVENGMRGYGVHFQEPYLGFEDPEYDFISAVWWQSFEHRGNMAMNYYKIAETHGQSLSSVVSCTNSRAYFVEPIFTTWE